MATAHDDKSTNAPAQTKDDTADLAATKNADTKNADSPRSNDKSAAIVDEQGVVDGPAIDSTDPDEQADDADRDLSDPAQNGNIGYSAEGKIVSNQMGEQVNTVQATDGDRAEALETLVDNDRTAGADGDGGWSDPNVTNQA